MPEDNAISPHLLVFIESAYEFFKSKLESGEPFRIADIRRATGYEESTVNEHMRVRWKRWFVTDMGNGQYRSLSTIKEYGKDFFRDMHTQRWVEWIKPPEISEPISKTQLAGIIALIIAVFAWMQITRRYGLKFWLFRVPFLS
jgi:hypothetical protein